LSPIEAPSGCRQWDRADQWWDEARAIVSTACVGVVLPNATAIAANGCFALELLDPFTRAEV
jgi:hypothetical protein